MTKLNEYMGIENIRRIKQQANEPKPKKVYFIPKKSKKRLEKENNYYKAEELTLENWFTDRRVEMKGICSHCGKPSCKMSDYYYKYSICHILPKAYFPSVADHPDNWIELCFWYNSCHTNMDNGILDMTEMSCWDEIVIKFQRMYPAIAKKERRRIPNIFLKYINTDL